MFVGTRMTQERESLMKRIHRAVFALAIALVAVLAVPQAAFGMQVFATSRPGERITLEVEPTDRIEDVRWYILDKAGIPVDAYDLYYGDVLLKDGDTLQNYNIQKDTWITIVIRHALTASCTGSVDDGLAANDFTLAVSYTDLTSEQIVPYASFSYRAASQADDGTAWQTGLPTDPGEYTVQVTVSGLEYKGTTLADLTAEVAVTLPAPVPGDEGDGQGGSGGQGGAVGEDAPDGPQADDPAAPEGDDVYAAPSAEELPETADGSPILPAAAAAGIACIAAGIAYSEQRAVR